MFAETVKPSMEPFVLLGFLLYFPAFVTFDNFHGVLVFIIAKYSVKINCGKLKPLINADFADLY